MAWTTPRTWSSGETVTAALMNTHVRDNLNVVHSGELDALDVAGATVLRGALTIGDGAGDDVSFHASAGFVGAPPYKPGSSGVLYAKAAGVIAKDGTTRGNTGAGENDGNSFTLEGNTLNTDGDFVELLIGGTCANNGNSKTLKVDVGAASITLFSGVFTNTRFMCQVWIRRTGASACIIRGGGVVGVTLQTLVQATGSDSLASDLTIKTKLTGTSANDIQVDQFLARLGQ